MSGQIRVTVRRLTTRLRGIWASLESSKWWRVIGALLILLSLSLMGRTLALNLKQFKAVHVQVNLIPLCIGLLLSLVALWMGTLAWGEIVRAMHPEIKRRDAINYHLVSIAAKYLPGLGWQQVSKVYQLHRGGVPASQTWQPVALELVLLILVGLAIAVQFFISTQKAIFGLMAAPVLKLSIAILLWVCCVVTPIVLYRFTSIRRSKQTSTREFLLHLWFAEILDIIGWLSLGLSLWFAIIGFTPLAFDKLPYCTITLIISFLTGLIIVFVPNGLGVREAVMFTFLQSILPVPSSIIVAFSFRIITVLAELLGVSPILVLYMWQKKR
jgi:hypothetical protein